MAIDSRTTLSDLAPAQIDTDTQYVRRFESLAEFARIADTCPAGTRAEENSERWCRGTRDDAMRLAGGEGWLDAMPTVERIATHVSRLIDAETISDSFTYRYDVTGGGVDVARFLEGESACMVETIPERVAKRGKVARVLVNAGYHNGILPETVQIRGAAVVALIDAMRQAHYSLEVWGSIQGVKVGDRSKRYCYAVKLLDAAETYRPEMLLFGLGHSLMLRKLSFLVNDLENGTVRQWFKKARGIPVEPRLTDLPEDVRDTPTIIIPGLESNTEYPWGSGDDAIARWIESQVETLTSEARDND